MLLWGKYGQKNDATENYVSVSVYHPSVISPEKQKNKNECTSFSVADKRRSIQGFSSAVGEVIWYLAKLCLVYTRTDLRSGQISSERWLWGLERIIMLILQICPKISPRLHVIINCTIK